MDRQYDVLGWNEQNVLTIPPFRQYLCKSTLRFFYKLFIIIVSWIDTAKLLYTIAM